MYGIKPDTAKKIVMKFKKTGFFFLEISDLFKKGIITKQKQPGRTKKLKRDDENWILEMVDENCTLTLKELQEKMKLGKNIIISRATLSRLFKEFHYTIKRVTLVPIERNSSRTVELRKIYVTNYLELKGKFTINNFFFLDEFGITIDSRKHYGRSKAGKRAYKSVAKIKSKNFSICCIISYSEVVFYLLQDHPFNEGTFRGIF